MMKKMLIALLSAAGLLLLGTALHLLYLRSMAPTEQYPAAQLAYAGLPKRAMVITAHDDDAISSAGTLSLLASQGWHITQVCFYNNYGKESPALRSQELQAAGRIQGIAQVLPQYWDLRAVPPDSTKPAYMPVPYAQFDSVYRVAALDSMLTALVVRQQPTLVFTLDDVIGGYGHSEHVVVSQVARRVCERSNTQGRTHIQAIYQAVFTPTQGEAINSKLPMYNAAKEVYQCTGMPHPTVQVNIQAMGETKQQAMLAYRSQHRNLKKFWPYYNWYPPSLYFALFPCEYYRVLPLVQASQSTRSPIK